MWEQSEQLLLASTPPYLQIEFYKKKYTLHPVRYTLHTVPGVAASAIVYFLQEVVFDHFNLCKADSRLQGLTGNSSLLDYFLLKALFKAVVAVLRYFSKLIKSWRSLDDNESLMFSLGSTVSTAIFTILVEDVFALEL